MKKLLSQLLVAGTVAGLSCSAWSYTFHGLDGQVYNQTLVPENSLGIRVDLDCYDFLGNSSRKHVEIKAPLNQDGSFHVKSKTVLCSVPGGKWEESVTVTRNDKSFAFLPRNSTSLNSLPITLYKIPSLSLNAKMDDGRSIEQWLKSPDGASYGISYEINFILKDSGVSIGKITQVSPVSDFSTQEMTLALPLNIAPGSLVRVEAKASPSDSGSELVTLYSTNAEVPFPIQNLPSQFTQMTLNHSLMDFSINGDYLYGFVNLSAGFGQGYGIKKASFNCPSTGLLTGTIVFEDGVTKSIQGKCADKSAEFDLQVAFLDVYGKPVSFDGTAKLSPKNRFAEGELFDRVTGAKIGTMELRRDQ